MGAASFTIVNYWGSGNKLYREGTGNLSSSYATGGDTHTARNLGLSLVDSLVIEPAGGFVFNWDKTNSKIIARTNVMSAGSLGKSLTVVGANATGKNDLYIDRGSVTVSGTATVGIHTLAQGNFLGFLSSAHSNSVDLLLEVTTGGAQFVVHYNTGAAGFLVSALASSSRLVTTATRDLYFMLDDGGLVKVFGSGATSSLAVTFRNTAAVQSTLITTATANITVAVNTSLGMVLPSDFDQMVEVASARDMSGTTFRWTAVGV